jgi:hypothetical protein
MSLDDLNNDKNNKCPSFFILNKANPKENFEISSEEAEEDLNSSKKFDENFSNNNNFDTELKTCLITNQNNKIQEINNRNEIINFNFFIIGQNKSNNLKELNSERNKINKYINNKEEKKRGRKRKRENNDDNENIEDKKGHNKYSDDNLRKKCKNIILKYALEFVNKKIKEKYKNNIGHGKFKKELKILNQEKKVKSTVDFDKTFLTKTLKDIFSDDISARFFNFSKDYNKELIKSLLLDKDEERKQYFIKLFNITFIDCLKYFREDEGAFNIEELNGFKKISLIKDEMIKKDGNDYVEIFIHYINNFEEINNNKKGRNRKMETGNKIKGKSNDE